MQWRNAKQWRRRRQERLAPGNVAPRPGHVAKRRFAARRSRVALFEQLEERTVFAGVWIVPEEVMRLPTSGEAWDNVRAAAERTLDLPNLQDQDEDTDVLTLAKALVAVRLNDDSYRSEVRSLVMDVVGTESVSGIATIANPYAVETTVTFSAPGTYLLRLRVDDGAENDEDALTIRVHAADDEFTPTGDAALDGTGEVTITGGSGPQNDDPDVYAGADQIVSVNDVVTLRGSASDDGLPDGNLTVRWEVVEPRTLALGRNLVSYVIAADLVGLAPEQDAVFQDWLRTLLTKEIDGRSLQSTQEERPNNWGTMAAASRAAIAAYLGDTQELERTAQVLRGFLGDRTAHDGFIFDEDDLTWHADPGQPRGVNPVGAVKDGFNIDGAIPDEMRRGGSFQVPPKETHYPWEALQGVVTAGQILHRAGFDVWQSQDQAILRAVQFLERIDWQPSRDDEWMPWVLDAFYDHPFVKNPAAGIGKNIGWTAWTHQFGAPGENWSPTVDAGSDQTVTVDTLTALDGTVDDDGLPDPPGSVAVEWRVLEAPYGGTVDFGDPLAIDTTARFSARGTYHLELTADDGDKTAADTVVITVLDAVEPIAISFQEGVNGYQGTVDTRIRSDQPTTNYGTNKKLELDGNPDQVSLIRWDLTGVPADSTVLSASITLSVVEPSFDDFELYQALRPWDEATATFQQAMTDELWELPGAGGDTDRAPVVLGKLTAPDVGEVTVELNENGIQTLQQWISNPATNFGFVIQDLNNASTDDLDFDSSEAVGLSPRLTIVYTLGPPPPPNQAPEANPDQYAADEDQLLEIGAAAGVLANDVDLEGDALTAVLDQNPASGVVELDPDGSFRYTPQGNFHGTDVFVYRTRDASLNWSTPTTVTINVASVNDPPEAIGKSLSTTVDTAVAVDLEAIDVDADPLSFTISRAPANGTLSGTSPHLVYTPNPGYVGADDFEFRVSDGVSESLPASVAIEVLGVNHPPVATSQDAATDEDSELSITLVGQDEDGDPLEFVVESLPLHGTLLGTAPQLVYHPQANFYGSDQFVYRVYDGLADSELATVTITVRPVNDPPVASDIQIALNKDTPGGILLRGSDVDGDNLSFHVLSGPTSGTLEGTAPNLIYTPQAGFVGEDAFTYAVHDGVTPSEFATVTIRVQDATPITAHFQDRMDGYDGTRDTRLRGDLPTENFGSHSKLELDGNPDQISLLKWDLSAIPPASTITAVSLTLNVVATSFDEFEIYEALRAWDEMTATYELAAEGVPWQSPGAAGDQDREPTVLGRITSPELGLITIALNAAGVATVQKWVQDPSQNHGFVFQDLLNETTDDLDFSSREASGKEPRLTIVYTQGPPPPPNDPPVTLADDFSTSEDAALHVPRELGVLANDHDPEGGSLIAELVQAPRFGDLVLESDGAFRYTPSANFAGADSFTYRAVDSGQKKSAETSVTISVTGVNDPPEAQPQSISAYLNSPVAVNLSGTDVDGDELSYVVTRHPEFGTLSGTLPELVYTPNDGFTGVDTLEFRVDDGQSSSAAALVTITVSAVREQHTLSFQDGVFPETSYRGTRDTKLLAEQPSTPQGSSSKLELDGKPDITSLLKWDIGQIPAGSTVTAASITVNVVNTSSHTYELFELLRPWDEATATFNESQSGDRWQIAGAQGETDRGSVVLGTITAPSKGFQTITLNVDGIAVVQSWVADSARNHGVVLQNFANSVSNDLDFTSREGSQAAARPKLVIEYEIGPTDSVQAQSQSLTSPEQNAANPYDVNGDTVVAPGDALLVSNQLNQSGAAGESPAGTTAGIRTSGDAGDFFPDVNGDFAVTALDALAIINYLNAQSEVESHLDGDHFEADGAEGEFVVPLTAASLATGSAELRGGENEQAVGTRASSWVAVPAVAGFVNPATPSAADLDAWATDAENFAVAESEDRLESLLDLLCFPEDAFRW